MYNNVGPSKSFPLHLQLFIVSLPLDVNHWNAQTSLDASATQSSQSSLTHINSNNNQGIAWISQRPGTTTSYNFRPISFTVGEVIFPVDNSDFFYLNLCD